MDMKRKWLFVVAPIAAVLVVYLCGELIMYLWNWLLPPLFGLRLITFWQALGLLLLCRILFGSWRGGGNERGHRRQVERWDRMSPEERERLRQNWRARCGDLGTEPPQSGETA
jgi:hypothetical protein